MNRVLRPPLAIGASLACAATSLVWLAPGAQATRAAGASPAVRYSASIGASGPAVTGQTTPTGASDIADLGTHGWRVASSATATAPGSQISAPSFDASSWLRVRNDGAGAPGTEVEALLQNGRCPGDPALQPVNQGSDSRRSVFFADNMRKCYGYANHVGAVTVPLFRVPWWWRTDFTPHLRAGQHATLIVNGVIGSANVWVNGHEVATAGTVTGAYTRFAFPVTGLLRPGRNSLAIEVNPNDPNTMFTLDDVDWNQIPPDNNTGIQFPVQLAVDGALTDGNAHVLEANAADFSRSTLTVQTDVTNNTGSPQTGDVSATITFPGGRQGIGAVSTVTVPANTTKTVVFRGLIIKHPQVWWPYQLGGQPLYRLVTSVSQHGQALNSTSETFGIRTVTSYLTGSSPAEPAGARAFKINGVPIVIRGGGFSPNIFLHYSAADIARQIALMKNMGVNTIRLEGHIMPAGFFDQMDRAGILINAGYQCCDAWQLQDSGLTSPADFKIIRLSALTIGQNLRNHPSVSSFQWSDNQPIAKQEALSLAAFRQAGFQTRSSPRPSTTPARSSGSPGRRKAPTTGCRPTTGTAAGSTRTTRPRPTRAGPGGTTASRAPGTPSPPSTRCTGSCPRSDLSHLWRDRTFNQYHANYEPRCGIGYSFGTLCHFDTALRARYGAWSSLGQYVEMAQAQDYENTRAQFEAYIAHSNRKPLPSTGTIYWQMNKGWPSLLWNLYGSDGDQAGSYFGAQEANRSLHAIYTLDNGTVTVDNLGGAPAAGPVGAGHRLQPRREGARRPGQQQLHAGQPAGPHRRAEAEGARPPHPPGCTSWNCNCASTGRWWTATCTGCPPTRTW